MFYMPSPPSNDTGQPSKAFYFSSLLCLLDDDKSTVQVQGEGVQLPFRALAAVMGLPVVV